MVTKKTARMFSDQQHALFYKEEGMDPLIEEEKALMKQRRLIDFERDKDCDSQD